MLRAPFALLFNLVKSLLYLFRLALFGLGSFLGRKHRRYVKLSLSARQPFGPAQGLAARFQDALSYIELREQMTSVASDPRIEGLLITADSFQLGAARTADIAHLIKEFRKQGKRVIFHLHSSMGRDYDLAMEGDQILITPGGRLYLFGSNIEQFFAAPLFERLGVVPQFVHIGPFKTAAHRFIHSEATPALRLMMNQLLDSLDLLRKARLEERRGISAEKLGQARDLMPLDDRRARHFHFIDHIVQRKSVRTFLLEGEDFVDTPVPEESEKEDATSAVDPKKQREAAEKAPLQVMDLSDYARVRPKYNWTPLFRAKKVIATMDLSGMIVMPGTEVPGQSGVTIDPDEVIPVLQSLAQNRRVSAVVLHINSPGGSALASEVIWDAIRRLRWEKPVIAYCSDMAASGGYYLAVACDQILCQKETITGSIGVIAGKFTIPGVLDKLGINHESYRRNETAIFTSMAEPLTDEVLQNLQHDARAFYRQFLRRVGLSRQLPKRRLHRFARGRVYTGLDAHKRHLVDHLGGFDDAVDLARVLAEVPASTAVEYFPHRKVSLPMLLRRSTVQSFVPDQVTELGLVKAMIDRDPLLALMPLKIT